MGTLLHLDTFLEMKYSYIIFLFTVLYNVVSNATISVNLPPQRSVKVHLISIILKHTYLGPSERR